MLELSNRICPEKSFNVISQTNNQITFLDGRRIKLTDLIC